MSVAAPNLELQIVTDYLTNHQVKIRPLRFSELELGLSSAIFYVSWSKQKLTIFLSWDKNLSNLLFELKTKDYFAFETKRAIRIDLSQLIFMIVTFKLMQGTFMYI